MKYTGNLALETCCVCGTVYAASAILLDARKDSGDTFWCPNGHGQSYTESTVDKLNKRLEKAREDTLYQRDRKIDAYNRENRANRSAVALKGHITRLKKRLAQTP